MVKVDIISGFLGAGKTTLIKNLFKSSMKNEKVVLIENEFGEIGVDGTFLKESGVEIKEINSGCICCSLVGDFSSSMKEVVEKFNPDRIIIEPSGVGRLSDIIKAVEKVEEELKINIVATVVDGGKCKMYHKNFGEFYNDQIAQAKTVIVSKTEKLSESKINDALEIIRELNPDVTVITTPVSELDPEKVLDTITEQGNQCVDVPPVPGSYYLGRYLTNAMNKALYQGEDPADALIGFAKTINEEIAYKREEFGLID